MTTLTYPETSHNRPWTTVWL